LEELRLPAAPDSQPNHYDVFQNYELAAERRDELKTFLADANIGTLVQWGGTAIHQFSQLGFNQECPRTEKFFNECIMLPMNVFISDDDVHYVADKVIEFYRS